MSPGFLSFYPSGRSAHHQCGRQQCMWSSPLFWMVFAIVSFWALGAYNRLMRLRSAVAQAFGSLDAHLVRLVALMGEFDAAHAVQRANLVDGPNLEMAALQRTTTQLSACLAVVRARPFSVEAVAALAAARAELYAAWHGAVRKVHETQRFDSPDAPDPLGACDEPNELHAFHESEAYEANESSGPQPELPAPSLWDLRWDEQSLQNDHAARVFTDAVTQYNAAIAQFPANVLARVFGFKAARGL